MFSTNLENEWTIVTLPIERYDYTQKNFSKFQILQLKVVEIKGQSIVCLYIELAYNNEVLEVHSVQHSNLFDMTFSRTMLRGKIIVLVVALLLVDYGLFTCQFYYVGQIFIVRRHCTRKFSADSDYEDNYCARNYCEAVVDNVYNFNFFS